MKHRGFSGRRSLSSLARPAVLLGALMAVQQPALIGQFVPAKLATVLADLVRAVPQDAAGVSPFDRFAAPPAMNALPRSVQDAARGRQLRFGSDNTVQVYILMSEVTTARLNQLAAAGVTVEIASAGERRVQARIPVRSLQRIAALPFVTFIRLPSYAIRHAGAVQTEGDAIHRSDAARQSFGVDGTGVRVGVISDGIKGVFGTKCDSCDGVSGGPIGSGDLPGGTPETVRGAGVTFELDHHRIPSVGVDKGHRIEHRVRRRRANPLHSGTDELHPGKGCADDRDQDRRRHAASPAPIALASAAPPAQDRVR